MNRLFVLAALLIGLVATSSCAPGGGLSPFGEKVVALGQVGLAVAAAQGKIQPGDLVTISKTVAIITTPGEFGQKLMPLAELGVEEAVRRGALKEGDVLLIQEGVAVLQPEVPVAGVGAMTGTK